MKLQVRLILCVCVLQMTLVDSNVIEKIKSGASNARRTVKCGLHQFGNLFVKHDHGSDPCQMSEGVGNKIDTDTTEDHTEEYTKPHTEVAIDVRGQENLNGNNNSSTIGPDGRRILFTGSNCPPGYRSDSQGRCREEY